MRENRVGYPSVEKKHLRNTSFWEKHPIIPDMNISMAMDVLNVFQQNAYVIDSLELRVTHKKLRQDGIIISKALLQLGIKKGDIIIAAFPNLYQAVAIFKGANRVGAVTTFINPLSPLDEIKQYIKMYNSRIIFVYNKDKNYADELLSTTCAEHVIVLDEKKVCDATFTSEHVVSDVYFEYQQLGWFARRYHGICKNNSRGNDEALILYTSGSTGEPKSLLFTNRNILAALIYLRNSSHQGRQVHGNNRWMGVVPIMYPYGFACSVLASILNGNEVVMAPDMSPEKIDYYYNKKPSLVFGSPAFLEVTKRNLSDKVDCSELKQFVSGGDFLSESQLRDGVEFFKRHNATVEICNGSGNGELLGCCTNSMNIENRADTVGQLILGPDYLVVNPDTYEEVKYGEDGVLLVHGKHVFKGYYGRDDLTQKAMVSCNGKKYYNTGNYGHLDEDRYFHMIGRASRFFIVYTLNKVYCELVQNVVSMIDVVDSCAVVPMPDKDMLFVSKAYVVLKQGVNPSEEMKSYIISESAKCFKDASGQEVLLKEYEIPRSVEFLSELPRTQADKIDYEFLRKKAETA